MAFVDNSSLLTGCANSWLVPGLLTTQKIKLPNAPAFTGSLSTLQNDAGFLTGTSNGQAVNLGNVTAVGGVNLPGSQAVNLGSDQTKALNAGTRAYQSVTPGAVDVFGAGTSVGSRNLKLWDNVDVDGTLRVGKGCRTLQVLENATVTGLGFQDASLNNLPPTISGQVTLSNLSPYVNQSNAGSLYFPAGQNYISYANTSPVSFDWTASNSSFECWANFPTLPTSNVALLGVGNPNSNTSYWSLNVGSTGAASMYVQTLTTTMTITDGGALVSLRGQWVQLQSNVGIPVTSYTIFDGTANSPANLNWTLVGGQDGVTWTALHSVSLSTPLTSAATYGVNYPGTYTYLRLIVTQNKSVSSVTTIDVLSFNSNGTSLPPAMTSSSTPAGYIVSASSTNSTTQVPYYAFDQRAGNEWYSAAGTYSGGAPVGNAFTTANNTANTMILSGVRGEWVQLQSNVGIPVTSYTIFDGTANSPANLNWTLVGGQDGVTWTALHSVSLSTPLTSAATYGVNYPGTYTYLRLIVTQNKSVSSATTIDVLSFNSNGTSLPPAMTSSSTPAGYIVSASSTNSTTQVPYYAFDQRAGNEWYSAAGTYSGGAPVGNAFTTANITTTVTKVTTTTANIIAVNTTALTPNTWSHLALTYSKPLALQSLFLNGTLISTASNVILNNAFTTAPFVISGPSLSTTPLYLTDVRATQAELPYTSNSFAVPTQPLAATANTQLLLRAQRGTNGVLETGGVLCGANTIVEVSQNNYNPLPLLTGNTYAASNLSPYTNQSSVGSIYLGANTQVTYGSNVYANLNFDYRAQDFTAETWIRPTTITAGYALLGRYVSNASNQLDWALLHNLNNTLQFTTGNSQTVTGNTSSLIVPGAWNHIAFTVSSGNVFVYTNGVCVGNSSASMANSYVSVADFVISRQSATPAFLTDVRVQMGLAAYTGNFTPPTQPLQATGNTQLLLRSQRGIVITNNQGAGGTQGTVVGNVQVAGAVSVSGPVLAGNLNEQIVRFNATSAALTYVTNIPCNTLGGGLVVVSCSWASTSSVGNYVYLLQQYNNPWPSVWSNSTSGTVTALGGNSSSWTFTNVGGFFAVTTAQVGINNFRFSVNHI